MTSFRLGMLVMMFGATFVLPFGAAISMQMKRMDSENKLPVLALVQFGSATMGATFLAMSALMFTATAFRPERSPEMILLLSDLAWVTFAMPIGPAVFQNLALGVAILSDKSTKPLFPRWVGYFNFWVALLFIPAGMVSFFKTGPFAWNGIIAFWMPVIVFAVWFWVIFPMLLKAIRTPDPV